jgi:hypothetical protein
MPGGRYSSPSSKHQPNCVLCGTGYTVKESLLVMKCADRNPMSSSGISIDMRNSGGVGNNGPQSRAFRYLGRINCKSQGRK